MRERSLMALNDWTAQRWQSTVAGYEIKVRERNESATQDNDREKICVVK